jgi:hypothetical protein
MSKNYWKAIFAVIDQNMLDEEGHLFDDLGSFQANSVVCSGFSQEIDTPKNFWPTGAGKRRIWTCWFIGVIKSETIPTELTLERHFRRLEPGGEFFNGDLHLNLGLDSTASIELLENRVVILTPSQNLSSNGITIYNIQDV